MKQDPQDANKYVLVELELEDISLLRGLFRFETALKLSMAMENKELDLSKKLPKIFTLFDSYRGIDDNLLDIAFTLKDPSYNKDLKRMGVETKNLVIVYKNVCKLYQFLCTDTANLTPPPETKELFDKRGSNLIEKISKALTQEFTVEELQSEEFLKKIKREAQPIDGLNINIFGNKGFA